MLTLEVEVSANVGWQTHSASESCVFQFLQRAHLHLDGGRLGCKYLFFSGERILAFALRLGWHLHRIDLEQAWQGEVASALLMYGTEYRVLKRSEYGLDMLRFDAGLIG
ncbi:hypothetical protein ASG87_18015 [Frateuria sp. Soil773]|nr:hypothetical protein ASG87_18015 [Frateuria sp. Soil773]